MNLCWVRYTFYIVVQFLCGIISDDSKAMIFWLTVIFVVEIYLDSQKNAKEKVNG